MLFCISADYTPETLVKLRENPTNRAEAMANLCEAAGGKLVAMYGTMRNGPGAMAIVDVAPEIGAVLTGLIASSGAVQNVKATRLFAMEEIHGIRQKAKELAGSYKAPGQQ